MRKQRCTILFRPGRPTDHLCVRSSFPVLGFGADVPGFGLAAGFFQTMTMKPDREASKRALEVACEAEVLRARREAAVAVYRQEQLLIDEATLHRLQQRGAEQKEDEKAGEAEQQQQEKENNEGDDNNHRRCVCLEAQRAHALSAASAAALAAERAVRAKYAQYQKTADEEADDETKLGQWSTPQVMVLDPDTERCVVRYLASSMFGVRYEQVMLFMLGNTSDGKSVTDKVITGLFSPLAEPMNSDVLIECHGKRAAGAHESHIADMCGKRLMFLGEIKQNDLLNAAQMKRITGGDATKTRLAFGLYFTIKNYPRVAAHSNHAPQFADGENGDSVWRRLMTVWCSMRYPDGREWLAEKAQFDWLANPDPATGALRGHVRPADEALPETLLDHAPGVFAYLLQHAHAYFEERSLGAPSRAIQQAHGKCRRDASGMREFLDECTEWGTADVARRYESLESLYRAYVEKWCLEQKNVRHVLGKKRFSMALKSTNKLHDRRHGSGVVFYGLRLKPPYRVMSDSGGAEEQGSARGDAMQQ